MSQHSLDALLAEATLAGQAGDFDHAIACFQAALKKAPRHPGIMLYLSKAYGLSFRYPEAERWLQAALNIAPLDERLLTLAAQNYQEWDRPDGALPLLQRAATRQGGAQSWLLLGRALERANQLPAAREAAARAAGTAPRDPRVLHLRGRLAQRSGDLAEAERLFEAALAQKPASDDLAELWYARAALYDATGRFDEAWDAATQAKTPQRQWVDRLREPAETWHREVRRIEHERAAWTHENSPEKASGLVILCGYPRSGTTLLGQLLAGHPQVTYADEVLALARVLRLGENLTEPPNADWFLRANPGQLESLRREYRRSLEAHLGKRLDLSQPAIIDKNPAVTRFVPAMLRLFPALKVLYPLRDPRDLAVSCYLRPFPVNAFTAQFNRLDTLVAHIRANHAVWQTICSCLPLVRLEVRYEQLIDTTAPTARAVCEFLGLDAALLPPDHRPSASRHFIHSPTYAEVLQPIHRQAVGRWRTYATHLAPCLDALHELARQQGYDA
jgi:tetratricopeptide (TPR) repeat protein